MMSDEEQYLLDIKQGTIPIFEITSGEKHYRIYYSGRVEGFTERVSIVNQCPLMYRAIFAVAGHLNTTHRQQSTTLHQMSAHHTE